MHAVHLLQQQFTNLYAIFRDTVGDLTPDEWRARVAPDQNVVGAIVWHIPRTHDHIVQTWIRGIPEVVHRPGWAQWESLRPVGIGTGVTQAELDSVIELADRETTLAYAAEVQAEILGWLGTLDDAALDQRSDVPGHLAGYPEYQIPGFRSTLGVLYDHPVWSHLMRPCLGHVHRHLGELQLAKSLLRGRE